MLDNRKTRHYADWREIKRGDAETYSQKLYYRDDSYIDEYGILYNWAAAVDLNQSDNIKIFSGHRQGVCPDGWHVPTEQEFRETFQLDRTFYSRKKWVAIYEKYSAQALLDIKKSGGYGVYASFKGAPTLSTVGEHNIS